MKSVLQLVVGQRAHRELAQTLNSLKRIVRPKHEPEVFVLDQLLAPGDVALKVGANYAQYSRVLSRLVGKQGRVFAFEPAGVTFRCLQRNCRLLGLHNVTPKKLALAEAPGTMTLHTPLKRKGVFGVAQASLEPDPELPSLREDILVDTIDNFVRDNEIGAVSFIRCDVEGAEMNVFQGAREVVDAHRPKVLVEAHQDMITRFGYTLQDLENWFSRRGYRFFGCKNAALVELAHIEHGNVFCLPD